jgi:hypothetical protein
MSEKRIAKSRRVTDKPVRARRSSQSARTTRPAAFDVVLDKLEPFFKTFSQEELAAIPAAVAAAFAQQPRGFRAGLLPRPPEPIEVVFPHAGREIVGALILKRTWMDRTFDEREHGDAHSAEDASERVEALSDWLNGFGRLLGSLLSREIALAVPQSYMHQPSDCLDMLEHYAETRPGEFERLWSLPLTQYFLPYLKTGSPVTRRRLRALENSRLTKGRGRPHVDSDESRDFIIASQVEAAQARLKAGWEYFQANQAEGRRHNREVLIGMGYQGDEATVLVEGRHRKLRGAAVRLVAQHSGRPIESVSVQASRGNRK